MVSKRAKYNCNLNKIGIKYFSNNVAQYPAKLGLAKICNSNSSK